MFFELHNEKKIGYKELTDADLGRQATSHQTHIGLFDDVLTFLPNNIEINDCMTIFDDTVELLSVNFDRIENPNHTFRSPKIRAGGRDVISVVSFIRDKTKSFSPTTKWYLFWFGLKSEQPVFFIFNNESTTYHDVENMGINLTNQTSNRLVKNRITESSAQFKVLLNYLENVINKTSKEIVAELEVAAQTNEVTQKKYRNYDIEKAKEIFSKIGKEGEFLIEKYFSEQKKRGLIANYKWVNENKECGLPYDFYFESLTGEIIYLDVKTTNYQFSQKMIFSNQEINFAVDNHSKYCIYRVYVDDNGKRYLKICLDTKKLFSQIYENTCIYLNSIIDYAKTI